MSENKERDGERCASAEKNENPAAHPRPQRDIGIEHVLLLVAVAFGGPTLARQFSRQPDVPAAVVDAGATSDAGPDASMSDGGVDATQNAQSGTATWVCDPPHGETTCTPFDAGTGTSAEDSGTP